MTVWLFGFYSGVPGLQLMHVHLPDVHVTTIPRAAPAQ